MSEHPTTSARRPQPDWAGWAVVPAVASLATVGAATALTAVIEGRAWFGYILVAVALVACVGLALRAVGAHSLIIGLAQLLVLLLAVTGMFTSSGILGVLPGPAAFAELSALLAEAGQEIRTGIPPVEGSAPILCLATIGIGMIAVLVDTLAVAAAAPAASGLVLLCLYAVPASLADEMLPWWTFALGASAFAVLIAVDGNHRHRRWRTRSAPESRVRASVSLPAAVVSLALAFGLVAGSTVTAIGTAGQLPFGSGSGGSSTFTGGLGVAPFTSLRGMLNDRGTTEVFRVRGLDDDKRLLRAFTLDTYEPNEGWRLAPGPMRAGVDAAGELPRAVGDVTGESREIRVEAINWQDVWLPVYGMPRDIRGIDSGWYYDSVTGAVYSERPRRPPDYTLATSLAQPDEDALRAATVDPGDVPAVYTTVDEIDPRVEELTQNVVSGAGSAFEQAAAIWEFFTSEGRFTYDTQTASASDGDALADFVLNGRRGFCEQFASAMAVMVRSVGIPARVAVGFAAGTAEENYTSITTRDAHAWVEVYLGSEHGWVTFDPTPLASGNSVVPPYLDADAAEQEQADRTDERDDMTADDRADAADPDAADPGSADTDDQAAGIAQAPWWMRWSSVLLLLLAGACTVAAVVVVRRAGTLRAGDEDHPRPELVALLRRWLPVGTAVVWLVWLALVGGMVAWWLALALLATAIATGGPALVREYQRGRRLYAVAMSLPDAADAAWRELLDESADRGMRSRAADTVRETARRIGTEYAVDDDGHRHMTTLVEILERSWYGVEHGAAPAELARALEGLRRALRRTAPLSWRSLLWPPSVLPARERPVRLMRAALRRA